MSFGMFFFRHVTAAKGLLLSSILATATLILLSPQSLSGRAAEHAGSLSDLLAAFALLTCLVGFADILWTDLYGRHIWPSLNPRLRHQLCVLLYASASAWYAILAFAATDVSVHTSWILLAYYMAMAWWGAVLTLSIAHEKRGAA